MKRRNKTPKITVKMSDHQDDDQLKEVHEALSDIGEKGVTINKLLGWLAIAIKNIPREEIVELILSKFGEDGIKVAKDCIKMLVKEKNKELAADRNTAKLLVSRIGLNKTNSEATDILHLIIILSY